jgi:hypothetical protein
VEKHIGFDSRQWATTKRQGMDVTPKRFKRSTPFSKQCNFIIDVGHGELEQCDANADFGIYYGNDKTVKMTSLCHYHTIYQESLWVGGMQ